MTNNFRRGAQKSLYGDYFGFETEPFGLTPDPRFFFASDTHKRTLEWLRYAVEQYELGLVLGDTGSGKTVLSRYLVDSLGEGYRICWILNPRLSPGALLQEIYRQWLEEKPPRYKRALISGIQSAITQFYQEGIYPILLIDEAQVLPSRAIEELRLLSNFQLDDRNLLSILFFGQLELEKRLRHRAYRAFIQRVRFTIRLHPLEEAEVGPYLMHRARTSGYQGEELFTPEAVKLIYSLSHGFPRVINHIANFSLLEAMDREQKIVDDDCVREAAKNIIYLENNAE